MPLGGSAPLSTLLCAQGQATPGLLSPSCWRPTLTAADGPPLPLTGTVPQPLPAAAAAPLGRPGAPSGTAAAAQAAAADDLVPRDEAGLPIASAAWVGLSPAGQPVAQPIRRALSAVATPAARLLKNDIVMAKMTTIIIPSACRPCAVHQLHAHWGRRSKCPAPAAAATGQRCRNLHTAHSDLSSTSLPCCTVSANESTGAICPGTSKPRGCPNTPCTTAQLRKVLFSNTTLGGSATADTVGRGFEKVGSGRAVNGQRAPMPAQQERADFDA